MAILELMFIKVHLSEERDFDIIIIASSRITSSIRVLWSVIIIRRVIDSIRKLFSVPLGPIS